MKCTVPWRAIIGFCAMCALGLWGCGGAGGGDGGGGTEYHGTVPDGYTAVSFTADAETGSGVSHDLVVLPDLGVLKDASATGTGTGTGVNGPTSIFDSVAVTCTFTYDSATNTEAYTVTNDQGNCANANECIVCTPAGSGTAACSLSCNGVVPSSSAAASDSFDVFVAFTSSVITDMPDPYGMLRHDVSRTGTAFDLSSPSVDNSGCTYNPGVNYEFQATPIAAGTWFTSTASNYRKGMTITALDPDAGNNNRSHCTTIRTFTANAPLTGAATPGTAINNNLGVVTYKTKVCDYQDGSPVAYDASVCTEP